jgi:hypothetical protein
VQVESIFLYVILHFVFANNMAVSLLDCGLLVAICGLWAAVGCGLRSNFFFFEF